MSLLDDARRIQEAGPPDYGDVCVICQAQLQKGHASDCPWLAMPKIINVIEAAGRVILDLPETSVFLGFGQNRHCRFCGRTTYLDGEWRGTSHETECPWPALVAALKDRESPPGT